MTSFSKVAKTKGFAERLRSVRFLVLDEVDQLAAPLKCKGFKKKRKREKRLRRGSKEAQKPDFLRSKAISDAIEDLFRPATLDIVAALPPPAERQGLWKNPSS